MISLCFFEFTINLSRSRPDQKPDNFINPNQLSNLEKKTLKEAFQLMTRMQGLVVERYKQFIR